MCCYWLTWKIHLCVVIIRLLGGPRLLCQDVKIATSWQNGSYGESFPVRNMLSSLWDYFYREQRTDEERHHMLQQQQSEAQYQQKQECATALCLLVCKLIEKTVQFLVCVPFTLRAFSRRFCEMWNLFTVSLPLPSEGVKEWMEKCFCRVSQWGWPSLIFWL